MTQVRSGAPCGRNERFADQYGEGDTGKYADHYGGKRGGSCGENDTCGCGDTSKYADHYGGGKERNDTCGCSGNEADESR